MEKLIPGLNKQVLATNDASLDYALPDMASSLLGLAICSKVHVSKDASLDYLQADQYEKIIKGEEVAPTVEEMPTSKLNEKHHWIPADPDIFGY